MLRTPCPTCICSFDKNPTLFGDLTSAKVHQELSKIKDITQFGAWLQTKGISLKKQGSEWVYPPGVCKSVQNKILNKIQELGVIDIHSSNQQDLFDDGLLPASDPDDMPPPIHDIEHPGVVLTGFDEEDPDTFALPPRGWNWRQEHDQTIEI